MQTGLFNSNRQLSKIQMLKFYHLSAEMLIFWNSIDFCLGYCNLYGDTEGYLLPNIQQNTKNRKCALVTSASLL